MSDDFNRPMVSLSAVVVEEDDGTFTAGVVIKGFASSEEAEACAKRMFETLGSEIEEKIGPGMREQ